MEEYVAKPPVFKAQQWDGTEVSALEIARQVKIHTGRVSARILTDLDDAKTGRRVIDFDFRGDPENRMQNGDWMVFHPVGGRVEILPDRVFLEQYEPKEK